MNQPELITFTGVDERTSIQELREISQEFSWKVEFGILFSENKQGKAPRYPSIDFVKSIRGQDFGDIGFAAHLCGKYTQTIMDGDFPNIPINLHMFDRIQINHSKPSPANIRAFASQYQNCDVIAQWRNPIEFEPFDEFSWLYDPSGGRGEKPEGWPMHPGGGRLVGYAGGINPDNVLQTLMQIDCEHDYWIDMESGVRTDDWFDLNKVRSVCKQVFG